MSVSRYVPVRVAVVDGKIYPVTELEFVKDSFSGNYYKFGPGYNDKVKQLIEMIWDTKKKCYKNPFVVEVKQPETMFGEYNIGDEVLVEATGSHRKLKKNKIVDIVFEEYSSSYQKYKKVDEYWKKYISEEDSAKLIPDELIEIRQFKPTYVFEDGYRTIYPHQFYRVKE